MKINIDLDIIIVIMKIVELVILTEHKIVQLEAIMIMEIVVFVVYRINS